MPNARTFTVLTMLAQKCGCCVSSHGRVPHVRASQGLRRCRYTRQWCVEWFDDDGGCELEFYTGPRRTGKPMRSLLDYRNSCPTKALLVGSLVAVMCKRIRCPLFVFVWVPI